MKSYEELAWTDFILSSPEEAAEEVSYYCSLIERYALIPVGTLLHLGSGAGLFDYTFKQHYQVTGVDISSGMLTEAEKLNPEVCYIQGDMRTADLGRTFDAVVIPDSIAYMTSVEDLEKALNTAAAHVKPGGVLLICASTKEEFRENNFVYTGAKDHTHLTLFENNYIPHDAVNTYEAALVYLIRINGELEIVTDVHKAGVFPQAVWYSRIEQAGFTAQEHRLDHAYDAYLDAGGSYPITVFICRKSLA